MNESMVGWAKHISGLQLQDDFVIDNYVGHGKIGFVYRAHRNDDKDFYYAVKLVFGKEPKFLKQEIQKVRRLSQVNSVVHFHQVWEQDIIFNGRTEKALITVWDFIRDAKTLPEYLRDNTINTDFLFNTIKTILRVLHHCGVEGIKRHGDLHPGNILISTEMTPSIERRMEKQAEIFVADFGYGVTGGCKLLKDDRHGLKEIFNTITRSLKFELLTIEEKQRFKQVKEILSKYLHENQHTELLDPASFFHEIEDIEQQAQFPELNTGAANQLAGTSSRRRFRVGDFLSGELFGDNKARWRFLFVDEIPYKSQIFAPNFHAILTGPRGCGKTTLFRRQSTRLQLLCELERTDFLGLYIHSNHFVDAFSNFGPSLSDDEIRLLISYMHLLVLSELLDVMDLIQDKKYDYPHGELLDYLAKTFEPVKELITPMVGEHSLQRLRSTVETIKHQYLLPADRRPMALARSAFGHQSWLETFFRDTVKSNCPWLPQDTPIVLLVDDYTTPRPNKYMQQCLNSVLFRRTNEYVSKVATEAATTFEPKDRSGKRLQVNDDFILVDFATVSLQLTKEDRARFVGDIFAKRLKEDPRIPDGCQTLTSLLGKTPLSMREFALQLRQKGTNPLYFGESVFIGLWSGDIRTLLQVMEQLVENAPKEECGEKLRMAEIPPSVQHDTDLARQSRTPS